MQKIKLIKLECETCVCVTFQNFVRTGNVESIDFQKCAFWQSN